MKRWLINILMTFVFLLHATFFGWVIWITYIRPMAHAAQATATYDDELEDTADLARDLKEHFHNIDESINIDKRNPSPCFKCHGTYPHSKAKDVRSFLNGHAFFIACEVCHVRREEGHKFVYKWIKTGTDEEMSELTGKPGNYGAVVVPFKEDGGTLKRLDRTLSDKDVQTYMKSRGAFTADQAAEAKFKIHKGISQKPVFCDECHKENGYLDFQKLHYRPERARTLSSMEVVGVIQKYKEFFIPTMFDPRAIMMERMTNQENAKKNQKKEHSK